MASHVCLCVHVHALGCKVTPNDVIVWLHQLSLAMYHFGSVDIISLLEHRVYFPSLSYREYLSQVLCPFPNSLPPSASQGSWRSLKSRLSFHPSPQRLFPVALSMKPQIFGIGRLISFHPPRYIISCCSKPKTFTLAKRIFCSLEATSHFVLKLLCSHYSFGILSFFTPIHHDSSNCSFTLSDSAQSVLSLESLSRPPQAGWVSAFCTLMSGIEVQSWCCSSS